MNYRELAGFLVASVNENAPQIRMNQYQLIHFEMKMHI